MYHGTGPASANTGLVSPRETSSLWGVQTVTLSPSNTALIATTAVVSALMTVAVGLRVYRRVRPDTEKVQLMPGSAFPKADDVAFVATLLPAWACAAALFVFALHADDSRPSDSGRATLFPDSYLDADPEGRRTAARAAVAVDFAWALATASVRVAVALYVRRVFFVWAWVPRLVLALIGLNAAWLVATLVALALQCGGGKGVSVIWENFPSPSSSPNDYPADSPLLSLRDVCSASTVRATQYGTGIADVVLGAVTFSVAPAMVWRLQMSARRGLGWTALFLLGWVSVAMGIARLAAGVPRNGYGDALHSRLFLLFSFLEPAVGLLVACLHTIRGLLVAPFRSLRPRSGKQQEKEKEEVKEREQGPPATS